MPKPHLHSEGLGEDPPASGSLRIRAAPGAYAARDPTADARSHARIGRQAPPISWDQGDWRQPTTTWLPLVSTGGSFAVWVLHEAWRILCCQITITPETAAIGRPPLAMSGGLDMLAALRTLRGCDRATKPPAPGVILRGVPATPLLHLLGLGGAPAAGGEPHPAARGRRLR